jgi:hypothetical protein
MALLYLEENKEWIILNLVKTTLEYPNAGSWIEEFTKDRYSICTPYDIRGYKIPSCKTRQHFIINIENIKHQIVCDVYRPTKDEFCFGKSLLLLYIKHKRYFVIKKGIKNTRTKLNDINFSFC